MLRNYFNASQESVKASPFREVLHLRFPLEHSYFGFSIKTAAIVHSANPPLLGIQSYQITSLQIYVFYFKKQIFYLKFVSKNFHSGLNPPAINTSVTSLMLIFSTYLPLFLLSNTQISLK